jgi:ligand-binding SRPBCC domain-containing protein
MRHRLYREQQINCGIEDAWRFFSSAKNLEKITPDSMGFKVVSHLEDDRIFEGMEIEYIVSPVLKIPLKWKTVIKQVEWNKSFTDFQASGPYAYWNHFHEFIPNADGVLMKDTVDYELPLGLIGDLVHGVFVKNKLNSIFNYRFQYLEKKFNA